MHSVKEIKDPILYTDTQRNHEWGCRQRRGKLTKYLKICLQKEWVGHTLGVDVMITIFCDF
jgi:hypothetical protein